MNSKFFLAVLITIISLTHTACKQDEPHKESFTPDTAVNNITFDKDGCAWFGFKNGIYRSDGKSVEKAGDCPDQLEIYYIHYTDPSILTGTNQGLKRWKIDESGFLALQSTFDSLNSSFRSNSIFIFFNDNNIRTWYGTGNGILVDENAVWKQNKEIHLNLVALSQVPVTGIARRSDDLHLATAGKYLFRVKINKDNDAITGASQLIGGQDGSGHNYNGDYTTDTIFSVMAARDSSIWFGSQKGLTRNKGTNNKAFSTSVFEYYLGGNRVYALMEDSSGKIWAGTGESIHVISGQDITKIILPENIDPGKIVSIEENPKGKIWIVCDNGLLILQENSISFLNTFK